MSVVRAMPGSRKTVICNGDEGDPGAFMDRMILESFPFRVLEGILIASYAVGADEAVLYVRAEYPLAVRTIRKALSILEQAGILGQTGEWPVAIRLAVGAGAFVCGEETALMEAIEGRRGNPRLRPPYPSEKGLEGRPTLVNNVETLALLPWIIREGADEFLKVGTTSSPGTKTFALAGKILRGGLIEVPMGLTLREIVNEIGGGLPEGRRLKAVQVGGPSGGCVPASLADTPVDYESLTSHGAIMGSGGMVVLDDTDCMVDVARYFLAFTQDESCGKCTFCRVGTKRLLKLLENLCEGKGTPGDLDEMEALSGHVKDGSLCGLGRTAPNPVLSTLRHFREEFSAHLEGRCPALKCKELIRYEVTDECIGCTRCAQHCPADAIPMNHYEKHVIDPERCIRCGTCVQVCPEGAVIVCDREP
jgi:NADH-quinone oxidoreductase subunit F